MDIGSVRAASARLGLYLRRYEGGSTRNDVLNITATDRELVRADVNAFRALLAEHDLTEVKSWVAWQGVSWLSSGTVAGVSFEVYDPAKDA